MGTPIRQREEHPAWFFKVLFLSSLIFLGVLSHPTPGLADEALELFNQAHTQIQQGHYEKASKSLTTAIELFPRFAEAHHLLGVVYFTGLNQPNKALASFKHAIAYYPNFSRAHHDLAVVFQHQKKYANAEAAFQKALELYPRFFEARVSLAHLYDRMKRPKDSIGAYQAVLELQPNNPDALYKLAYWSYQVGDREQAGKALSRLVEIDPTHLAAWILLGQIEETSHHPFKAIYAYQKALGLKGELIDIRYAVGVLFQEQGKSQEAEQQFKEVIRLNPKDAEAHLNLGVIYANMNRLDEAEQAYKSAISLNPQLVDAYYNLGVFYEFHRNDTQKALAHYHEYVKQGGADDRITNLLKKTR